jgi:hypothetical protein
MGSAQQTSNPPVNRYSDDINKFERQMATPARHRIQSK